MPTKLQGVAVNLRGRKIRYYNFAENDDHARPQERLFLVEEYEGIRNDLEPTAKRPIPGKRHTMDGLSERYGIPVSTFKNWVGKFWSEEDRAYYDDVGRPHVVDDIGIAKLVGTIKKGRSREKQAPVLSSSLESLLLTEVQETRVRRGKRPLDVDELGIARNTVKTIKKDNHIRMRKPKDETHARDVAERSIRCTYKFAVMLETFAGKLPADLKFNADGTQYECKEEGSGDFALVVAGGADDREEVVSVDYPTQLSCFLKHVQLANAAGKTGPLVIVAAVPSMPKGEFYFEKIPGLAQDGATDSYGVLYSCSSRAGNAALWRHWLLNIVIPCIAGAQAAYGEVSVCFVTYVWFTF